MISVIIPVLNEAPRLAALIGGLQAQPTRHEIIVVDGGSRDGSAALAQSLGATVLHSAGGRGGQLAAGARAAAGDIVLFLHADTEFPAGGLALIEAKLAATDLVGGNFRIRFEGTRLFVRALNRFYGWIRSHGLYYGDSAIFVRRPVLEDNVVNAKAGCLYPNNARMMVEARSKGFGNALVADAMGNVAESASANVFMVKDGEVFTPIPNGTFLAGITRARHMSNMRDAGMKVHETVLSFDDFHAADEVFLSGNMMKVTPVRAFDDTQYGTGDNQNPVTRRVREMYWDWAASQRG